MFSNVCNVRGEKGLSILCTDKKRNFLIYEEIREGAVAKSHMTNGLPSYMVKYFRNFLIKKLFLIDDSCADQPYILS